MIKTNLKGAAGVQIGVRDVSGRSTVAAVPYRIGLIGWTPKGPANVPTVVSTESELYAMFGTPTGYKPEQVYLLHNAKIILNAGAEVVVVRVVDTANSPTAGDADTFEELNYGVYDTAAKKLFSNDTQHDVGVTHISYNMRSPERTEEKKSYSIAASTHATSPLTMFMKYPGFDGYYVSVQPFESNITGFTGDAPVHEAAHTLNASSEYGHNSEARSSFSSYIQSLGVYTEGYSTPSETTGKVKLYGDFLVAGKFYTLNGLEVDETDVLVAGDVTSEVENTELNKILKMFMIVRVYTSKTSSTPIETIYGTIGEYVTGGGDQLDLEYATSNLLLFKTKNVSSANVIDSIVERSLLSGGNVVQPVMVTEGLVSAWGLFSNVDQVEVSMLVDGGASINKFGTDRENNGDESGNLEIVRAMLKASSSRMDAPSIIDLPKRSSYKKLVADFKKYPSVGNEVDGSTEAFATFWGNAQDGRNIVNDTFNKKQIEVARSVFKAVVAYNVFTNSYPWQTQWGPNRGLIGSPSIASLNPRLYPDEVGPLSVARINSSKLTSTGEYFWDDYTLMAKSSVLQRWHAVCFLANLNKRYRRLLEQFVAELNTPALRKTIWTMINEDLNFIMNHADPQGLYNYYVICDETNNPAEVIDSGVLNVDVGLEIVRDTRVISLTTTLYKTGGIKSDIKL